MRSRHPYYHFLCAFITSSWHHRHTSSPGGHQDRSWNERFRFSLLSCKIKVKVKIILDTNHFLIGADTPTLFLFSADRTPSFRSVRLRARKNDCVVCGEAPTIKELIDYVEFCGAAAVDKVSSF